MSVEFDTPANRIIAETQPKNKFRIDSTLPDLSFLRQLSIQGRLRYMVQEGSGLNTITPQVGETVFIYQIWTANASAGTTELEIRNDGQLRGKVVIGANTSIITPFFDSLVGDNVKTFTIQGGTNFITTLFFWSENTSRIRESAI